MVADHRRGWRCRLPEAEPQDQDEDHNHHEPDASDVQPGNGIVTDADVHGADESEDDEKGKIGGVILHGFGVAEPFHFVARVD